MTATREYEMKLMEEKRKEKRIEHQDYEPPQCMQHYLNYFDKIEEDGHDEEDEIVEEKREDKNARLAFNYESDDGEELHQQRHQE